jgi:cytidylate kinase
VACRVVCITSEEGAGGREAAKLVASRLGFRIFDEDIVLRAALEAGVEQAVVADVEKRRSLLERVIEGLGSAGLAAGTGYAMAPPPEAGGFGSRAHEELRGLIRSVIEETAGAGSAVIYAHAASLALGERPDVLRVAVTASPRTRVRRLASEHGVDERDAARAVKRSDAERADYIKRFYGIDEEQPTHYDVVINTDKLSFEDAAEVIVQAAAAAPASARVA